MLVLEDRGLIFDATGQPPQRRIAYFTSLCVLSSGKIVCGFQNGPGKHAATSTIGLCQSSDGGESWDVLPTSFTTRIDGRPGSLAAAELVEVSPSRLLLFATWFDRTDSERPLFDPVTEGILKSKQLLAVSTDGGNTWSGWREIPTGGLNGCALTGPIVQWKDGTLAFPFESWKEYDDPRPGQHAAWLMLSRDGGESFSSPQLLAQHPDHTIYYWDQRLCAGTRAGEFTALFWTHDVANQRDLTVHLRHGQLTEDSIVGPTIRATTIPGQIAAPARCGESQLLAFVVDRSQPGTMSLWCSPDLGATWPATDRLLVYSHNEQADISQGRDNIDFKQYWEDMGKWTFGHPAIRPVGHDRFLLAWYAGVPDCLSLHWARVRLAQRSLPRRGAELAER